LVESNRRPADHHPSVLSQFSGDEDILKPEHVHLTSDASLLYVVNSHPNTSMTSEPQAGGSERWAGNALDPEIILCANASLCSLTAARCSLAMPKKARLSSLTSHTVYSVTHLTTGKSL